jgi:hypothetical protein
MKAELLTDVRVEHVDRRHVDPALGIATERHRQQPLAQPARQELAQLARWPHPVHLQRAVRHPGKLALDQVPELGRALEQGGDESLPLQSVRH